MRYDSTTPAPMDGATAGDTESASLPVAQAIIETMARFVREMVGTKDDKGHGQVAVSGNRG